MLKITRNTLYWNNRSNMIKSSQKKILMCVNENLPSRVLNFFLNCVITVCKLCSLGEHKLWKSNSQENIFRFSWSIISNHIKCTVFKLHVESRQMTFKCSTAVREKKVVVSCAGSNTFAHAASHKYSAWYLHKQYSNNSTISCW